MFFNLGNSSTSTPYTKNIFGRGPVWNNSLFEDNAEFGYGMLLGQNAIRESLVKKVVLLMGKDKCNLKVACNEYLNPKDNSKNNLIATDKLLSELKNNKNELAKEILDKKDFLLKKSQWVFGGDGWAYDIGFGGFVHLIEIDNLLYQPYFLLINPIFHNLFYLLF